MRRRDRAASAALAGWSPRRARPIAGGAQLGALLQAHLARQIETRRHFLATPLCLGLGVALYFAADTEPSLWAAPVALTIGAAAIWGLRHRFAARLAAMTVVLIVLGFELAALRTIMVAAPRLPFAMMAEVEGRVIDVEPMIAASRITVDVVAFAPATPSDRAFAPPQRLRVTVRGQDPPRAGDLIIFSARLLPPAAPALPGGYDFARDAYFDRLGAVGSVRGDVVVVAGESTAGVTATLDRLRNALTARIMTVAGGQPAALSAALITGHRGGLSEETNDALRASGLYHIVSISGLHMALVAGLLFFGLRLALTLAAGRATRAPIKKYAAAGAIAGAAFYAVFSGSEVATIRSLIMTSVMLGAILVDRPALSLRNVAIAAIVILAIEPETLLGPSFQMSFAAVAALIAAHEAWRDARPERTAPPAGFWLRQTQRVGLFVIGLLTTTLIASFATAPFANAHFQTLNSYGLVGNLLAVPVVTFVVMPAALFGAALYPFGLDQPVWLLMAEASAFVIRIAAIVAAWPDATITWPTSVTATATLSAGVLAFTLLRGKTRALATLPLLAGLGLAAVPERADLLIAADGATVLMRSDSDALVRSGRNPSDFVAQQWLAALGAPAAAAMPPSTRCDPNGCVFDLPNGASLAHTLEPAGFADDCRRADILVTALKAPGWCRPRVALIDRAWLDRHGAASISFGSDGAPIIRAARDPAVQRPWIAATDQ
jgi:competence protein ComEC